MQWMEDSASHLQNRDIHGCAVKPLVTPTQAT